MQILDNVIIVALHVLCFIAGVKLANYYNNKHQIEMKEALERQYLRLKTRMDADDPCRPYVHLQPQSVSQAQFAGPVCPPPNNGFDSPIDQSFMQNLKDNGKAVTGFKKSDLTR